jgi:ribosomal-protein-alanine N-acetyltransferase
MTSIRHVKLDDLQALCALDQEAFGDGSYNMLIFRQLLDLFPSLAFIAEGNEGIEAFSIGGVAEDGSSGWILALAVHSRMRRKGVGETITRSVLAAMALRRIREVHLTADPNNSGAITLYRKLGFSDENLIEDYYGMGAHRIVMSLVLPDDPEKGG